jgi:hypothetical protein
MLNVGIHPTADMMLLMTAESRESIYGKAGSLVYHFDSLCLAIAGLTGLAFALSPVYTGQGSADAYLISGLIGGPVALVSFLGSLELYARGESQIRALMSAIEEEGFSAAFIARYRVDPDFGRRLTLAAIRLGRSAELEAALGQHI